MRKLQIISAFLILAAAGFSQTAQAMDFLPIPTNPLDPPVTIQPYYPVQNPTDIVPPVVVEPLRPSDSARPLLAVTGDDGGCIPQPGGDKLTHPTQPTHQGGDMSVA